MINQNYLFEYDKVRQDILLKNRNSSHAKIANLITPGSRVLEFGPASGYFTKFMKEEMNCEVDIIEISESYILEAKKHAKRSYCGDIERSAWFDFISGCRYDYIVFADVLEHLADPWSVLKKVQTLLKDKGEILISYPNVCHNDVLAAMIMNYFTYTNVGIMDHTHLRFFGKKNINELFTGTELKITHEDYTYTTWTQIREKISIPWYLRLLLSFRTHGRI